MLTPEYLQECTDRIVEIYDTLHLFAIRDIARRLMLTGIITPSAKHQIMRIQQAGLVYDDVMSEVAKLTGQSKREVKRVFEDAAVVALDYDDSVYRAAGLAPLPLKQSTALLQILQGTYQQTNATLVNFTQSIALASQQAFFDACDGAYMQVLSGVSDYNSAIKRAVMDTARKGITVINYASGTHISVEGGVRRAVVTGVNQGTAKVQIARADDMGADLVEVSAHLDARPEHAVWQGKIYSRSGTSKKYPDFVQSTGYGTGPGLCGWNCRHHFHVYIEGQPRAFKNTGDTSEAYELTQKQRAMERAMRQTQREMAAAKAAQNATGGACADMFADEYKAKSKRYTTQMKAYNDFSKDNGLRPQYERTRITRP